MVEVLRFFGRKSRPGIRIARRPWDRMPAPPDAFLSAEFAGLHPVDLNFNNQWQLAGLKFVEENGHFTLALQWRCLKAISFGWLRCLATVRNGSEQSIASLDHDLLDGNPPPSEWRPGDTGYEVRYLNLDGPRVRGARLSLGAKGFEVRNGDPGADVFQLHLGLADTNTGLRLPLVASTVPAADNYTAAIVTANTVPGADYLFRREAAAG